MKIWCKIQLMIYPIGYEKHAFPMIVSQPFELKTQVKTSNFFITN